MGKTIQVSSNEQEGKSRRSIQEIGEETQDRNPWSKCCIYRVPWSMKSEDNEKAHVPCLVSLGPYHFRNENLQAMESHKQRALRCMLRRSNNQTMDTYLSVASKLVKDARACYEDFPDDLSNEEFALMLVVDSCFILETLLCYSMPFEELGYHKKDPVFSKQYMLDGILRDMILLENQIPLFVLERLHGLKPDAQIQKSVVELAIFLFKPDWVTSKKLKYEELPALKKYVLESRGAPSNVGLLHCLDIFRQTLLYPKPDKSRERKNKVEEIDPKDELIPCATQLKAAGVKFVMLEKQFPFWDISFERGNMKIPQILINESSESMFLNLMAFEQCHLPREDAKITSYIALLDNLINSASDVAQLIEDKILIHTLGSDEEVSNILNRLGKGVYFSVNDGCFAGLYEAVNEYSGRKINQWRAKLAQDYFNSPWALIGVIAGALELVLSFVQAVK